MPRIGAFGDLAINESGSSFGIRSPDSHGASVPSSNAKLTPDNVIPSKLTEKPVVFLSSINSKIFPSGGLYINSVTLSAAEGEIIIDAVVGALQVSLLYQRTVMVDVLSMVEILIGLQIQKDNLCLMNQMLVMVVLSGDK